jgi:RNA polymerase sigma-B factor
MTVDDPAQPRGESLNQVNAQLFARLAQATDAERAAIREEIVLANTSVVNHIAWRYRDRGEPIDDLRQVGMLGLLGSIDRFDPERGVDFLAFATPGILGEIRRHFRDHAWSVHVPRGLKTLRAQVQTASEELAHKLGHEPSLAEVARVLEVTAEDVVEALESARAFSTIDIDAPTGEGGRPLSEQLGSDDLAMLEIENREVLAPLIRSLPPRERRIILQRFYRNMSQAAIAEEIGVSQVQVSRLLRQTLDTLRERAGVEDATEVVPPY